MGTVDGGLRCSDGEREFGEGRGEPVVRVEVEGQFVVTAAQVLDERMSCTDHCLQAGICLWHDLPLATRNRERFDRVDGPLLVDVDMICEPDQHDQVMAARSTYQRSCARAPLGRTIREELAHGKI